MGLGQKLKCKSFLDFELNKPETHNGLTPDAPFKDYIKKFGLVPNTVDFIGHAIVLYTNYDFLDKKAITTVDKMQIYFNSFGRY